MFHFKGDTVVAWLLLVQMKHAEINGCALTGERCLLTSVWSQHRPQPFPGSSLILTQRICFAWCSKRCMIVKYWFRTLKDVLLCTTVHCKCLKERLERSVRGQSSKCWALWGKPKLWCFSHSMPSVLPRLLYHRHKIIISNTKTH